MSALKDKLKRVEDDISAARDERAAKVAERESAKETFAASDNLSTDSPEFKAAEDAVREVGAIDDRLADLQAAQVGILRMLGEEPADVTRAREASDRERRDGRDVPAGWNSKELLASDSIREILTKAATASEKNRFGGMDLGQVADRDTLAADVTGTANMRLSTYQGVLPQIFRPLRVLDLLPVGTTDGNSVPYTQEGGTFGAAETAEGTAKPEDGVTFTDATAPVQTIAAWQKLRKQALADFSALQSIIDTRLRYSVQRRLEGQVLNGNGTDPNLRGILQTSGIGNVAFSASVELADLILSGITQVLLSDAMANGVVVNPSDWQTLLSAKAAGDGHYFSAGPFSVTPQVIWGIPLLPSPAVAQGTALVGDFQIGASLLIREGVQVLLSDSDQDDFIKNRITLLGEMRAALPVWRPAAFSKVALV